ncbi:N-acetylgalactosamine-specific PTS system EIIB component 1 [Escherichia coli]|nr:N-acetylgalactosamine-specific PTS system EIIB component 1 [Escherichia coli]STK21167.1 N-acetylgalactosamine-specific PTS system EIIB component 1 [Escherichia coli]
MSSPNILLTRIDNRLVHGQVGVTWTSTIGANLLVVVDDVVANDDIQQKLRVLPQKPTALAFVSLLSKKPLTSSAKLHRIRRSS